MNKFRFYKKLTASFILIGIGIYMIFTADYLIAVMAICLAYVIGPFWVDDND